MSFPLGRLLQKLKWNPIREQVHQKSWWGWWHVGKPSTYKRNLFLFHCNSLFLFKAFFWLRWGLRTHLADTLASFVKKANVFGETWLGGSWSSPKSRHPTSWRKSGPSSRSKSWRKTCVCPSNRPVGNIINQARQMTLTMFFLFFLNAAFTKGAFWVVFDLSKSMFFGDLDCFNPGTRLRFHGDARPSGDPLGFRPLANGENV